MTVSLDKPLIPWLELYKALWICIETLIWTFNPLIPIEVHYKEKNPEMFPSKTLIFKGSHEHLRLVNYHEIWILEWTNPLI